MPKRVYIASPYSGDVVQNVSRARQWVLRVHELGATPVSLPAMTGVELQHSLTWEAWMVTALDLLRMCDGALFVDEWRDSRGCAVEWSYADLMGTPRFQTEDGKIPTGLISWMARDTV